LPGQDPLVAIDQFDMAEIFQIGHGLGRFQAKQTSSDRNSCFALVFGCEFNEVLEILDRAVYENSLGIVAGGVCWKDGIRASCKDENIIGDRFSR
jgi:hypothetical protein